MNTLNKSSIEKLGTVNMRMQVIVTAAATALESSKIFFIVTQGLRTKEQQAELYAQGRTKPGKVVTWTMNSNHLSGRAVDLAPLIDGKLNWDENDKLGAWLVISTAMKNAAVDMGEELIWGGDWIGKKRDRPHFELARG